MFLSPDLNKMHRMVKTLEMGFCWGPEQVQEFRILVQDWKLAWAGNAEEIKRLTRLRDKCLRKNKVLCKEKRKRIQSGMAAPSVLDMSPTVTVNAVKNLSLTLPETWSW